MDSDDQNNELPRLLETAMTWRRGYDERRFKDRGPYEVTSKTAVHYTRAVALARRRCEALDLSLTEYLTSLKGSYALSIRKAFRWHINLTLARVSASSNTDARQKMDEIRQMLAWGNELDSICPSEGRPAYVKRKLARSWDTNWRESVYEVLPNAWKLAYLVSMFSGCRPSELERGIKVSRTIVDDTPCIQFDITSSKVTEIAGQPHRTIVVDASDHPLAIILATSLDAAVDLVRFPDRTNLRRTTTQSAELRRWSEILRSVAKTLPEFKGLTAYCLRHQFAADINQSGCNSVAKALALGHIRSKGVGAYGGRSPHARGWRLKRPIIRMIDVAAERPLTPLKQRQLDWFKKIRLERSVGLAPNFTLDLEPGPGLER